MDPLKDYEEVPVTAVAASKWLVEYWEKLGKPTTPLTPTGKSMMNIIITVWQELYPQDAKEWLDSRKDYKVSELSISTQVQRHTGRSLASYPYPIFQMMHKIFPEFDLKERKNILKLVKAFPIFLFANKA